MPKHRFDVRVRLVVTEKLLLQRRRDIYALFLKKRPSLKMLKLEYDREESGLQQFVNKHLRSRFAYATGIGVIEAVDAFSISQIENGYESGEEIERAL